jgi:nucleoside-diphosphate-sugar epimerase
MKVFVAGATGVLGRSVVRRLVERGHRVTALSRSEANAAVLRRLRAEPRPADLFDAARLRDAVAGCEAVLHLATAIPTRARTTLEDWEPNDRIRRDGTRHLVAGALHHRARVYVQQSVMYVYGDRGGAWVDESTPVAAQPPLLARSAIDMEGIVNEAAGRHGLPAVTLRFGAFYHPEAAGTRAMLQMTKENRFPILGSGRTWWNLVHVEDAAAAVVAAVERHDRVLGRTLNVSDGEPVPMGEILDYLSTLLAARPPRRIPAFVARFVIGPHALEVLLASYRSRSDAVRAALGWSPAYPSFRMGLQATVTAWSSPPVGPPPA